MGVSATVVPSNVTGRTTSSNFSVNETSCVTVALPGSVQHHVLCGKSRLELRIIKMSITIILRGGFVVVTRFMMLMRKRGPCFSVWFVRIGFTRSVLGRGGCLIRMTLMGLCVGTVLGRMSGWDGT